MLLILGFVVPSLILLLGLLGKKLVSAHPWPFTWDDFYLGLEFTLATFTACILNFCDLQRLANRAEHAHEKAERDLKAFHEAAGAADIAKASGKLAALAERRHAQSELLREYRAETGWTVICLVFSVFAFFSVGFLHRYWEPKADATLPPASLRRKRFQLAGIGILLGYVSMVIFMLGVKGLS